VVTNEGEVKVFKILANGPNLLGSIGFHKNLYPESSRKTVCDLQFVPFNKELLLFIFEEKGVFSVWNIYSN
jgi:hypothetical protein